MLTTSRLPQGWSARLGRYLTREYSWWLESWLRRCRNPLAVISLAMGASVSCGLGLGPQGFVTALVLLVVLILGVAWPYLIMLRISGSFTFQQSRAREGDGVPVK